MGFKNVLEENDEVEEIPILVTARPRLEITPRKLPQSGEFFLFVYYFK